MSTKISTLRTAFALAPVVVLLWLGIHWLLFTVLDRDAADTLKNIARALLGADGASTLRTLLAHGPTLVFSGVGIALFALRHQPSMGATAVGRTFDRHAHWLMPMAGVMTVFAAVVLYRENTQPLFVSHFFGERIRGVLDATLASPGGWGIDPAPGYWRVPFGYWVAMHPLSWKLAGLLPFAALYALWRKRRALTAQPPHHGGSLTSRPQLTGPTPTPLLPRR